MKKWFNINNIKLVAILVIVIGLFAFSNHRNSKRKITKFQVEFTGKNQLFLTHNTVNKLLIENKRDTSSIIKLDLDLNKMEHSLQKHKMIEKSEVFVSIEGVCKAKVKQKTPIARVVRDERSYYIDYQGKKMPLSDLYSARVPLIYGTISAQNKDKFVNFLKKIYNDSFFKKNIIGVKILSNETLILYNRMYDYEIEFGKLINVEKKLNNYKIFFLKMAQTDSLKLYKNVNLKFTQQVVCTKH